MKTKLAIGSLALVAAMALPAVAQIPVPQAQDRNGDGRVDARDGYYQDQSGNWHDGYQDRNRDGYYQDRDRDGDHDRDHDRDRNRNNDWNRNHRNRAVYNNGPYNNGGYYGN